MENKYTDIPLHESKSVADIYDELSGSRKEKETAMRSMASGDPVLGKKLFNHHKGVLINERRNISAKDKLYLALDVEKRAKRLYEMNILENQALQKEMMSKGILNKEVMRAIKLRQQAENSAMTGGQ
jgi:hypothetical protein